MKRLLVCGPKGGSGKTNTARSLAVAAAREGLQVITADFDRQRTLTKWWRRRSEKLARITNYDLDLADAQDFLKEVADGELVIMDTPPTVEEHPAETKALIMAADYILIPCRPTIDDAESAVPMMQMILSYNRPAAFVVNAVKPRVNTLRVKKMLIRAGTVCPVEIGDRADYPRAAEDGMALAEIPKHAGADEISGVWEFVRTKLWGPADVEV